MSTYIAEIGIHDAIDPIRRHPPSTVPARTTTANATPSGSGSGRATNARAAPMRMATTPWTDSRTDPATVDDSATTAPSGAKYGYWSATPGMGWTTSHAMAAAPAAGPCAPAPSTTLPSR